jgi:hypothetical protein
LQRFSATISDSKDARVVISTYIHHDILQSIVSDQATHLMAEEVKQWAHVQIICYSYHVPHPLKHLA